MQRDKMTGPLLLPEWGRSSAYTWLTALSFLYFSTLPLTRFLIAWVELLVLLIELRVSKNPFNAQFHEAVFMEYKIHIPALKGITFTLHQVIHSSVKYTFFFCRARRDFSIPHLSANPTWRMPLPWLSLVPITHKTALTTKDEANINTYLALH